MSNDGKRRPQEKRLSGYPGQLLKAVLVNVLPADKLGGEKRHCELMMAGYRVTPAGTIGRRPTDDIGHRAITLDEIKIGCGQIGELMAEVSNDGYCFQKDLRHNNCRTVVDIDAAARHLLHYRTK